MISRELESVEPKVDEPDALDADVGKGGDSHKGSAGRKRWLNQNALKSSSSAAELVAG
jgi:hypothetical protein